ncbi:MAG: hypothetical protein ACR2PS_11055, partial [Pseudomonadales bacterium]
MIDDTPNPNQGWSITYARYVKERQEAADEIERLEVNAINDNAIFRKQQQRIDELDNQLNIQQGDEMMSDLSKTIGKEPDWERIARHQSKKCTWRHCRHSLEHERTQR